MVAGRDLHKAIYNMLMGKVLSLALTLVVLKIFFPELTGLASEFIARILEVMIAGIDTVDGTLSTLPIR